MRRSRSFALVALALAVGAAVRLDAAPASWRIVHGEVRVTCPMTIGGSFEAKTSALTGAVSLAGSHPTAFSGDLSVDLTHLDTGIGLRNNHLRSEYLEVGKGEGFERAVLSDIKMGEIDPETFQGRTTFSATFSLHGTERPVTGEADVRRQGTSVRIEASFPVTLAEYGIPKPQYLGVGVKEEVEVKVSLVAEPQEASAGGAR